MHFQRGSNRIASLLIEALDVREIARFRPHVPDRRETAQTIEQ